MNISWDGGALGASNSGGRHVWAFKICFGVYQGESLVARETFEGEGGGLGRSLNTFEQAKMEWVGRRRWRGGMVMKTEVGRGCKS